MTPAEIESLKNKMTKQVKIKFWDNWTETMYYWKHGEVEVEIGTHGDLLFSVPLNHLCIPLRYAGKNDKNGKEIYVGDILKIEGENYKPKDCIVTDGGTAFRLGMGPLGSEFISNRKVEIIGNIFENPELAYE